MDFPQCLLTVEGKISSFLVDVSLSVQTSDSFLITQTWRSFHIRVHAVNVRICLLGVWIQFDSLLDFMQHNCLFTDVIILGDWRARVENGLAKAKGNLVWGEGFLRSLLQGDLPEREVGVTSHFLLLEWASPMVKRLLVTLCPVPLPCDFLFFLLSAVLFFPWFWALLCCLLCPAGS